MSALRENREAAASPLVAIHERLDELTLAIDAVVTAIDPDGDPQAHYEAAETLVKLRAAAAKIRGYAVAGSAGEWFARRRAAERSKPYISTDKSARRERVTIDGVRARTNNIIDRDGRVVGHDEG